MLFNCNIEQPQHIEVKESPLHGRGVFAKSKIRRGSLIEQAPVIFLSNDERQTLRLTKLFIITFYWAIPKKRLHLVLVMPLFTIVPQPRMPFILFLGRKMPLISMPIKPLKKAVK